VPDQVIKAMAITGGPGPLREAVVSIAKGALRYTVVEAVGQSTASGASFTGRALRGGAHVKGAFHC